MPPTRSARRVRAFRWRNFTVNASTTVALPYGTWTLQITGKTPVGSWPVVTLDPRVATTATANVKITS